MNERQKEQSEQKEEASFSLDDYIKWISEGNKQISLAASTIIGEIHPDFGIHTHYALYNNEFGAGFTRRNLPTFAAKCYEIAFIAARNQLKEQGQADENQATYALNYLGAMNQAIQFAAQNTNIEIKASFVNWFQKRWNHYKEISDYIEEKNIDSGIKISNKTLKNFVDLKLSL